ncbi:MAG: hypothetical protein ACI91B_003271, partial [Planctomycetota bacterium]
PFLAQLSPLRRALRRAGRHFTVACNAGKPLFMRCRNLILLVVLVILGACRFSHSQVTQIVTTELASDVTRTIET